MAVTRCGIETMGRTDAQAEAFAETHIAKEIEAAKVLSGTLAAAMFVIGEIDSDLFFVRGYDKISILGLLLDMMPAGTPEVVEYARTHLPLGDE